MRSTILIALFLAGACTEPPAAARQPAAQAAARPPPAAAGTPEERAASAVSRALRQEDEANRIRAASPGAPAQTGEPAYAPLDIGGAGEMPEMPNQVSPAFRGL